MTPATSVEAIAVAVPTKLTLITFPDVPEVATVRVTGAVWVSVPNVPVTLIVDEASGVLEEVVTVSVEVPEVLIEVGLNVAVAPEGVPVALNETVPLNPLAGVTVTV